MVGFVPAVNGAAVVDDVAEARDSLVEVDEEEVDRGKVVFVVDVVAEVDNLAVVKVDDEEAAGSLGVVVTVDDVKEDVVDDVEANSGLVVFVIEVVDNLVVVVIIDDEQAEGDVVVTAVQPNSK